MSIFYKDEKRKVQNILNKYDSETELEVGFLTENKKGSKPLYNIPYEVFNTVCLKLLKKHKEYKSIIELDINIPYIDNSNIRISISDLTNINNIIEENLNHNMKTLVNNLFELHKQDYIEIIKKTKSFDNSFNCLNYPIRVRESQEKKTHKG